MPSSRLRPGDWRACIHAVSRADAAACAIAVFLGSGRVCGLVHPDPVRTKICEQDSFTIYHNSEIVCLFITVQLYVRFLRRAAPTGGLVTYKKPMFRIRALHTVPLAFRYSCTIADGRGPGRRSRSREAHDTHTNRTLLTGTKHTRVASHHFLITQCHHHCTSWRVARRGSLDRLSSLVPSRRTRPWPPWPALWYVAAAARATRLPLVVRRT